MLAVLLPSNRDMLDDEESGIGTQYADFESPVQQHRSQMRSQQAMDAIAQSYGTRPVSRKDLDLGFAGAGSESEPSDDDDLDDSTDESEFDDINTPQKSALQTPSSKSSSKRKSVTWSASLADVHEIPHVNRKSPLLEPGSSFLEAFFGNSLDNTQVDEPSDSSGSDEDRGIEYDDDSDEMLDESDQAAQFGSDDSDSVDADGSDDDGSDDGGSDDDSDGSDDSAESFGVIDSELFKSAQQFTEDSPQMFFSDADQRRHEAVAVYDHRQLHATLMRYRIRLQSCVSAVNRLPADDSMRRTGLQKLQSKDSVSVVLTAVHHELQRALAFLPAMTERMQQLPPAPGVDSPAPVTAASRKRKRSISDQLAEHHDQLLQYSVASLSHWHHRCQEKIGANLLGASAKSSSLAAQSQQAFLSQLEAELADEPRLMKQTHNAIAEHKFKSESTGGLFYDDTDFYAIQLRDLINEQGL